MTTRKKVLMAVTGGICLSGPVGAVDFIRQIQVVDGQTVVYDTPVSAKTGTLWSKPVQGAGAVFQLYAYKDDSLSSLTLADANLGSDVHANVSLESHLVDINLWGINIDLFLGNPSDPKYLPDLLAEKTVGTYIPEASITLTSQDSHIPARTRADQPYQLQINVGKLPPLEEQVPAGSPRIVSVEQSYKLYHPTLFLPAGTGAGEGRYSSGLELSKNGTFSLPSVYQQLPGTAPTQSTGEETFTATVKIGANNTKSSIASGTIQIWPVAKVEIQGIPANARFLNVPTNIQVDMSNLYPDSVTYARIYSGPPKLGATGNTIGSSVISYNTYSPQKAVVPLSGLGSFIDADGIYTVEVVTITPFNNRQPERVAYASFEIDRTIEVNASTTTINQ